MLIISDKKLNEQLLDGFDVRIEYVSGAKELIKYNKSDVIAICGSRAMAIATEKMEFPNLKLFQLTSAGFDGVPCNEFAQKSVTVANAGNCYSAPIAETVILGMLQFSKRLHINPNNRLFKVTRNYKHICELMDKKALIMGAGNIGTAIAKRLVGFDMCIDGYDPYCTEKPPYNRILGSVEELKKYINEYDFIISTLPALSETERFINKELLSLMNSKTVFINVGRRSVIDENDLYFALKQKQISGAVLDMFEVFPNPITNKFRRLKNAVVLPGVSAISQEVNTRLRDIMSENVASLLKGEKINNIINEVKTNAI